MFSAATVAELLVKSDLAPATTLVYTGHLWQHADADLALLLTVTKVTLRRRHTHALLLYPLDAGGWTGVAYTLSAAALAAATRHRVPDYGVVCYRVPRPADAAVTYFTSPLTVLPTRIVSVAADLKIDALRASWARAIQATAEWNVFAADPGGAPAGAAQRLLTEYDRPGSLADDARFAVAVLPHTEGALHTVSKNVVNATTVGDTSRLFLWRDGASAPSVAAWIAAAEARARAYVGSPPGTSAAADGGLARVVAAALDAHVAYFQARLPATALAWVERVRTALQQPTDVLADALGLTSAAECFVRTHRHARADVARYCVGQAPRPTAAERTALHRQIEAVRAPFVAAWDDALRECKRDRVLAWGRLAELMVGAGSGRPFVQAATLERAREERARRAELRRQMLRVARLTGEWLPPDDDEERLERLAALDASTVERLTELFTHSAAPACVRHFLKSTRDAHHADHRERFILAKWLTLLQRDPVDVPTLVQFALDVPDPSASACAAAADSLKVQVDALLASQRVGNAGPPLSFGCRTIISGSGAATCACPYAGAAVKETQKDGTVHLNIGACARACADATGNSKAQPVDHPLERLLWLAETALDW